MATVTTTASRIIEAGASNPVSFTVHAPASNSAPVQISQVDNTAATEYEELTAGQSESFEGFIGTLWAVASSGTQNLTLPFVQYRASVIAKQ